MSFKLNDYITLLSDAGLVVSHTVTENPAIALVSYNSKEVIGNTLFICKGAHFKPEYLQGAVESGAVCYVADKEYAVDCPHIIVNDIRKAIGLLANFFYENVWQKLNLIGITGTKGKSTTAYFVKYILDEYVKSQNKPESAIISSIDTYDGVEKFESHLTTPEPLELHKHFSNAVKSGIEYLSMEVSSQALKYGRVQGVTFDVGCYLNIGNDHISDVEHQDADDYFYSKMLLFSQTKTACVNLDSDRAEEVMQFAGKCEKVLTFSRKDKTADIYGYNIRKIGNDTAFTVKTPSFTGEFSLTIPGLFNVENALAAIAICYALEIPQNCMYVGLMKARSSGRMEIYSNSDNKVIAIVDYAHNRMSFENLFNSVMQEFPNRKIMTVFGCPGYKALTRRKDLGEIAGKYSDKVFITEEDHGEEPLMDICKEIAVHVEQEGCPYEIIEDRGEAIRKAIFDSDRDSILLITGKGNETRMKRGIQYIDCPTDVEYTVKYLKEFDIANHTDASEKIGSFQEILPKLRKVHGKTILIKLGGSVLEEEGRMEHILEDISLLKMVGANIILVHGGGKKISKTLDKMGIETKFSGGYRVTGKEDMEVVEMVLSGNVNKRIVQELINNNIQAVGISGRDGGLLCAEKKQADGADIGYVGEITKVNPDYLHLVLEAGYVPVISPVSADEQGNAYNINADDAAFAIAEELAVDKLLFITDVNGILLDVNNSKTMIESMSMEKAKALIDNGFVGGGMIPKLKNCVKAIENGVKSVVILNGNVKNNLVTDFISKKKISTTIEG